MDNFITFDDMEPLKDFNTNDPQALEPFRNFEDISKDNKIFDFEDSENDF